MGPMRPSKRATKTAVATLGWSALWLVLLVLCRLAIPEVEPPWLERAVYFGVPSLIVALTWWLLGREERETARIAKRLAAIATHSGWWIVPAAGTPTEPVICLEPGLFNALESIRELVDSRLPVEFEPAQGPHLWVATWSQDGNPRTLHFDVRRAWECNPWATRVVKK